MRIIPTNRLRALAVVLDCGGKRSATTLWNQSGDLAPRPKALSPLRSAGAVQILVLSALLFSFYAAAEETNAPAPATAKDFFNAGTKLLDAGKFPEAEKMFQSALAAQDDRVQPPTLYNLGHTRFAQGVEILKKGPDAQQATALANPALVRGGNAIRSAESALAENNLEKMVAAYLEGRGARRNLRAAEKAVQAAMETYGQALDCGSPLPL